MRIRALVGRDRVPQLAFLAVTTAVAVWARGRWLDPTNDAGFSWSLAYRLGHGERLYRDVYLVYGPLSPYLLAATGRPFGFSALWYLLASWIPAIVAGWLVLECARRYLSILESLVLAALLLGLSLFAPGAGRLVLPYYAGVVHALGLSLGALLLVQAPPERLRARAFGAGALAGLALCCKPELGFAALAGLLAAAAAGIPRPAGWLVRVLSGFALVAGAAFFFALSCDSLASLKQNSHLWPLNSTPPPELEHLLRIAAGLADPRWPQVVRSAAFRLLYQAGLLALLAMILVRERQIRRWLPLTGLLAVLALWLGIEGPELFRPSPVLCLSTLAAFAAAALAFFCRSTPGRTFFVAFSVFAGLAGARTVFSTRTQGPYDGPAHLAQSLTWVLLLCVLLPPLLTGGGPAAPWARRFLLAAVFLAAVPEVWAGVGAMRFPGGVPVRTRRQLVYLEEPRARFFQALAQELRPGEDVLVLPEISAVDVLFDVHQASPFLNHLPGWYDAAAEDREIERLQKSPPAAVVLFERPIPEYGVEPFGRGFGRRLAAWIEGRYRPVASVPAGTLLRQAAALPGGGR